MKNNNTNPKQNDIVNKSEEQLAIELGWSNRSLLSSYFALYGTILLVVLRIARHISMLDEVNGTNFAESQRIAGMTVNEIIENFPIMIDKLFLVLAINSVESSFENLVNKYNLSDVTEDDIKHAKESLAASFFAYLAAKVSHDIDVATEAF